MKLTRPSEVQRLLVELDFRPSKVLGQNFLIDANILGIMVEAAVLSPTDVVLEIGPGLGVLTEVLLARARRVVAVEKDARLYAYLQTRFSGAPNLELIHADVMDIDLEKILAGGVSRMVSNLPYAVGTRALVELIESAHPPPHMVFTIQRDVADRLTAQPGTKVYGSLSIWAQAFYEVELKKIVAPSCFLPAPQVTSAIVEMMWRGENAQRVQDLRGFHELVKQSFMRRRKQLGNILPAVCPDHNRLTALLAELQIDPKRRPESLSVSEWIGLSNRLNKSGPPS